MASAEVVVDDDEVAADSITQLPFLHTYPNGQHLSPHSGSESDSLVVCMELSGSTSTFCPSISQVMVAMVVQSWPSGQHRAVVLDESEMHVSPDGQQKLLGSPPPHVV